MAFERRVNLAGSDRNLPAGARETGAVPPDEQITITVLLKRKDEARGTNSGSGDQSFLSHHEFTERHGADPADLAMMQQFADRHQLTVAESSAQKSMVCLAGTVAAMEKAFDVTLNAYEIDGKTFRGRTGPIKIPEDLSGCVLAILGLDNRPIAQPHFRVAQSAAADGAFTPPQVAALYNFPTNLDGTGQTIALIELGGGFAPSDLQTYFSNLGIKQPKVAAISVDGGQNTTGSNADGEVLLDIEVAGAIAPGANIAVYFAPNTDQGFVDAVTNAVHDTARKPSVVSISWGASEDSWTEQARQAMDQAFQDAGALGVTVTVACGDNGSDDGQPDKTLHVDFPASSPFALACGGTTLKGSGNKISSEVVWNNSATNRGATGGGVSKFFALPTYQSSAGVPKQPATNFVGRGLPDVSGDADPATGYKVRVDGKDEVVGGTSAVAPLWAALVALINQKLGKPVGFINPLLYPIASAFHDITQGNNDSGGLRYYQAQAGWDACTGLGTPDGVAILNALSSGSKRASAGQTAG